jgi:hypothetical protein
MKKSLIFLGLNFAVLNSVFSADSDTTSLTVTIPAAPATITLTSPATLSINPTNNGTTFSDNTVADNITTSATGVTTLTIQVSAAGTNGDLQASDVITISSGATERTLASTGTYNGTNQNLATGVPFTENLQTPFTITYTGDASVVTAHTLTPIITFTGVAE